MARAFARQRRMKKRWSSLPFHTISMTGTGTFFGAASLGFSESETIIRLLGEYAILPTSNSAAGDRAIISVGIGIVSTDAAVVGAASLPDPAGDAGYPWMYSASHPLAFSTATSDPNQAAGSVRRSFDIKSMRKVTSRESLVLVVEYNDIVGAPPLTITVGQVRVLIAQ